MKIDIEDFIGENSVGLIISYPTGVFYTGQTGGLACNHPEFEGILLSISDRYFSDIDTCNHPGGCASGYFNPDDRMNLAKIVNVQLQHIPGDIKYRFDFDRIDIFEEACIPVILNGSIGYRGEELDSAKGILFTNDNCD